MSLGAAGRPKPPPAHGQGGLVRDAAVPALLLGLLALAAVGAGTDATAWFVAAWLAVVLPAIPSVPPARVVECGAAAAPFLAAGAVARGEPVPFLLLTLGLAAGL